MDPEEQEWIREFRGGDRGAFEPIWRRYRQRAYFTALGLLGNREDALDVSQEAFLRVYRALRRFDPDRPFYPWFYRILRNLCLNRLARSRVRVEEDSDAVLERIPGGPEGNPERQYLRKEVRDAVWRALAFLPPGFREILVLREFQGHSYREIADLLDIPAGTVMSRLYHARRELAERLAARLDLGDGCHGA